MGEPASHGPMQKTEEKGAAHEQRLVNSTAGFPEWSLAELERSDMQNNTEKPRFRAHSHKPPLLPLT